MLAGACTVSDCQREVDAAYQQRDRSGYRSETTTVLTSRWTRRMTVEFAPPDRTRILLLDGGVVGSEVPLIEIGKRFWYRMDGRWLGQRSAFVADLFAFSRAPPDERTFVCLGPVEFAGKTYAGYRAPYSPKHAMRALVVYSLATREDAQEIESEPREQPPLWRTVLLDRDTGLPAYEIVAPENKLEQPTSRRQYSYPPDITIEPPLQ